MTDKQTEEDIVLLKQKIRTLEIALEQALRDKDKAEYRKEIAEWAVVGVVKSRAQVTVTFDGRVPSDKHDIAMVMEIFGSQAAFQLLSEAELSFRAHAEVYEMRQHILYLENHARAHGLQYTPFLDSEHTTNPPCKYWFWPFPKAFSGTKFVR